jgi:enoyl-CoA hydratase
MEGDGDDRDELDSRVDRGVAYITLRNERRLNALTPAMLGSLAAQMATLEADLEVRAVVLAGAGTRAFASGADLTAFGGASAAAMGAFDRAYRQATRAVAAFPRPVIAGIHGYCLGGGLGLALQADIRLCDDASTFGIPAATLGIAYTDVRPLVRAVGAAWSAEILYSGRRVSSAEAWQMGLVNRVLPAHELDAAVEELAVSIASNAPLSIAASKAALSGATGARSAPVERTVAAMAEACYLSADFHEGLQAFAEKRRPQFRGR